MDADQAAHRQAMARLEALVGEWTVEASFPSTAGVAGRVVFEWILDGQFLVERAEVPGAPDSVAIIGFDPDREAYAQHYFDARGVARVYGMHLDDDVWTLVRDAPDFTPLMFSQRFTGRFSADGASIDGRWETSAGGSGWEHDFDLTYTRVHGSAG
jgi:hypothetical protein